MENYKQKIKYYLEKYGIHEEYNIVKIRNNYYELEPKYYSILTIYEVKVWIEIINSLEVNENLSYFSSSKIHLTFL